MEAGATFIPPKYALSCPRLSFGVLRLTLVRSSSGSSGPSRPTPITSAERATRSRRIPPSFLFPPLDVDDSPIISFCWQRTHLHLDLAANPSPRLDCPHLLQPSFPPALSLAPRKRHSLSLVSLTLSADLGCASSHKMPTLYIFRFKGSMRTT